MHLLVLFLTLNHQCTVMNLLKHSVSVIKTNQLILCTEIIVTWTEI
jgi:flagellar biosynthesis protein FliR